MIYSAEKLDPFPGICEKRGEEARLYREVEYSISEAARCNGWEEVVLPLFERPETFNESVTGWLGFTNKGFFLTDVEGPAVIIPEGTASVCRIIAKDVRDGVYSSPKKLFYCTQCFRNEPVLTKTKRRQFGQIGFEYIGYQITGAEVECIETAQNSLEAVGISKKNMLVRLSDVALFRKISENMGAAEKDKVESALDAVALARANNDPGRVTEMIRLASEFGSSFRELVELGYMTSHDMRYLARKFSVDISFTGELLEELNCRGVNAIFDPAIIRGWSYYSGPVFQMDIDICLGPCYPEIAGGGRYDKLIGNFLSRYGIKSDIPATGFAFGTDRLCSVLADLRKGGEV